MKRKLERLDNDGRPSPPPLDDVSADESEKLQASAAMHPLETPMTTGGTKSTGHKRPKRKKVLPSPTADSAPSVDTFPVPTGAADANHASPFAASGKLKPMKRGRSPSNADSIAAPKSKSTSASSPMMPGYLQMCWGAVNIPYLKPAMSFGRKLDPTKYAPNQDGEDRFGVGPKGDSVIVVDGVSCSTDRLAGFDSGQLAQACVDCFVRHYSDSNKNTTPAAVCVSCPTPSPSTSPTAASATSASPEQPGAPLLELPGASSPPPSPPPQAPPESPPPPLPAPSEDATEPPPMKPHEAKAGVAVEGGNGSGHDGIAMPVRNALREMEREIWTKKVRGTATCVAMRVRAFPHEQEQQRKSEQALNQQLQQQSHHSIMPELETEIVHVGDAGACVFRADARGGRLCFMTTKQTRSVPNEHGGPSTPDQFGLSPQFRKVGDISSDGVYSALRLRAGDVVVLGSDGLWDNMTVDEIGFDVYGRRYQQGVDGVQKMANCIAHHAHSLMHHRKPDDITVIIGRVQWIPPRPKIQTAAAGAAGDGKGGGGGETEVEADVGSTQSHSPINLVSPSVPPASAGSS